MTFQVAVIPPHPGEVLRHILAEYDITQQDFADRIHVSRVQLNRLLNGAAGLSPLMACRLGIVFGEDPRNWLTLQYKFDLAIARIRLEKELELIPRLVPQQDPAS